MNQLEALKQFTTVVADTGDFKQLAQFRPQDATTNPSLILKAVQKADYQPLLADTVAQFRGRPLDEIMDRLLVRFGREILASVPGRVLASLMAACRLPRSRCQISAAKAGCANCRAASCTACPSRSG